MNVAPNFIFGYIFLVVAFVLILCYILGYSYQEVVHRIETVLEPMHKISMRMVVNTYARKERKLEQKIRKKARELKVIHPIYIQRCRRLLRVLYVFIAQLVMFVLPVFSIASFVFFTVLRTFYCSIIIWRGQLPFDFTVIDAIDEFIRGLYFKEIASLFYPFIYFYKLLSLFQINLGGIDVTCSGAQLPLVLVTDLAVFTMCLSITCTDFQVYADMFADIVGNWASDVHMHDESEESGKSKEKSKIADGVGNQGSDAHIHDESGDNFYPLELVSNLYPHLPSFGAIKGIRSSLLAYAYFTVAYFFWLMVAILTAAVCLVVDILYMLFRPILNSKQFFANKLTLIVRKVVNALLSFTPLQRCESYYSIACCFIYSIVFYCVRSPIARCSTKLSQSVSALSVLLHADTNYVPQLPQHLPTL